MFWKWDFFVLFVTYKNVSLIWIRHHCRFNNSPKRDIWCVPPGHGTSVPAVSILFLHSATRLLRIFSKAVHHGSITLCLFCFSTTIKFEFIILLPFIWSNISIIWKLFVIHKSLISLDSRSPMLCTSESLIRLLFLARGLPKYRHIFSLVDRKNYTRMAENRLGAVIEVVVERW